MSLKRTEKTYNGLQNFKHLFDNLKSRTFVMMMFNNVKTYSLGKIMNNCSNLKNFHILVLYSCQFVLY